MRRQAFKLPLAPELGSALSVSVCAPSARADWPIARHDAKRTGATDAGGEIRKPVPYFKHYLGGIIDDVGLITADVDGDGEGDVIYVSGGPITAKHADDR